MGTTVTDNQVTEVKRRTDDALNQLEALFDRADAVAATIRSELATGDEDGR